MVFTSARIGFKTFNPILNLENEWEFVEATEEEINEAVALAWSAYKLFQNIPGKQKGNFLRQIAYEIEALGDKLIKVYCKETGLPEGRAKGECGRTCFQLRTFADLVEKGDWVNAVIDTADKNRKPAPKPDLRKMSVPIGPIAVFGASNFPLAYSTAGGDTASAFASGCPVIVKSHPMHAGTGELVASAIIKAAQTTKMPNGVFSNLNSSGIEVGQQLVKHSNIKGIGFTGSINGGRALYDMASQRKEPIPVFAEMGSINPVILLPKALEKKGSDWAKTYASSITLGTGQFCTNPGLLLGIESDSLNNFIRTLSEEIINIAPSCMLNPDIISRYRKSIVKCKDAHQLEMVINSLEGQLTGTLISEEGELEGYAAIINAMKNKVGRLIFNGVPTGVEVCPSMQHGGPYPASTDSRFGAVGIHAIERWVRPVSYQNWPNQLLPDALKNENPLGIQRVIDGSTTLSVI